MNDKLTIITLILAAIPTTIASIVAAVMTIRGAKAAVESAVLSKETHNMVNGAMLIQLKLHAKTARELADLKNDAEAGAIAALAEKMLEQHKDKLINIESGVAK